MIRDLAWIALWFASMSAATMAASMHTTAPIVNFGYAQYQGYFDSQANMTRFLSIRYAAPPLGNLRFRAPQPPAPQSGIQPATQNPNMCYQAGSGVSLTALVSPYGLNKREGAIPAASEDCLFLNVFVPGTIPVEPLATRGLPVLVWIHGGGYANGYAAEYDGADLVTDSLDSVIVVVIQYRLGAFGFLSGNEIKAYGALNAGLLDQRCGLQWVQDYIGLLGGDKTHVTIWGESAGAGSVLQHIVANGGRTVPSLFSAAITSSLAFHSQYYYNDRVPELLYNDVVSMTGCASHANTFACLQSVEAGTLQTANQNIAGAAFFGTFAFVPVVDGRFIIERPTLTLAKGRVNGHVLLGVTNQNEGTTLVDANETLTITDYISQLFPDMSPLSVQQAARVYQDYGTALEQAILVMADSRIVCPTYYLLQTFSGPAWKGLFAIPPAYHGQDRSFYFNSFTPPRTYNNTQFDTAFSESFMSLARYYDVNIKFNPTNITPYWDKYDVGDTEMLFNRTEAGEPVVEPVHTDPTLLARCAFWSTVTSMTAQ